MRRIDDFVKLLVGIVIGQFLRDAHAIRDGLRTAMGNDGSILAESFPLIFVAFVVRNVHASFRYDSWCIGRGFVPPFERRVTGRALSFGATLTALFVSSFAVEHYLAVHLSRRSIPPDPAASETLALFLLLPFLVYLTWDGILWVGAGSGSGSKDRVMNRFITRWIAADLVGVVWLLGCLAGFSLMQPPTDGGLARTLTAFSTLASVTILVDYTWNRSFYFGEIRPTNEGRVL